MKLKPNTTYRDGCSNSVHILGPTGRTFEGKTCWWSVEGNHYTEEGLLLQSKMAIPDELGLVKFTTADSTGNLESEDESEGARLWWSGVET